MLRQWQRLILLFITIETVSCLATTPSNVNHNQRDIHKIISRKEDDPSGTYESFTFRQNANDGVDNNDPTSTANNHYNKVIRTRNNPISRIPNKILTVLRTTFLPHSTTFNNNNNNNNNNNTLPTLPPSYIPYVIYNSLQDLTTQLRSILATQRILEGVGVGRSDANVASASLNFIIRDGMGMASSLIFTSLASQRFRGDIKRWRLLADGMVDLGITLEVAAGGGGIPKALFLPMICLGNMCKAICGVAAGACGGAINLHWAKGSDISDINAKFGAQQTVTGAMGLIFGAFFARTISSISQIQIWTVYSFLTFLHIYANTRCMKLVIFDDLNQVRMDIITDSFLSSWWSDHDLNINNDSINEKLLFPESPQVISKKEPLFFILPAIRRRLAMSWLPNNMSYSDAIPIKFGISFNDFITGSNNINSSKSWESRIRDDNHHDSYLITIGHTTTTTTSKTKKTRYQILVCLLAHATPEQTAKAYFHSKLLRLELNRRLSSTDHHRHAEENDEGIVVVHVEEHVRRLIMKIWPVFRNGCDHVGWNLSKTNLRTEGYCIEFMTPHEESVSG